jgi:hypothetical protein
LTEELFDALLELFQIDFSIAVCVHRIDSFLDLLKFQVGFLHGILYGVVQMLLPKAALDLFNRDFA